MSFVFADSFDLYAAAADTVTGYWDSGTTSFTFSAGRFGGQCIVRPTSANTIMLTKSSGSNDAVHHIAVAFNTSTAISGTNIGSGFTLYDGATAQCSVNFRSDGAILLIAGIASSGTTLATYTGAFSAASTWYQFEFEVVINNTTGSFKVRKNGNTTEDFTATGLNTRASANNYANKLSIVNGPNSTSMSALFDDFFWRSDASSVAWMGDVRCYTRMPASDASVTFSRSTGSTNYTLVDEAQQNAATDYVFSSNPGDADFYGIASISATPATVLATTVRGYMQKSDAGTRTAAVQVKSGGTTAASSTLTLSSSGWLWAWRTDLTDPATGAAWTPTAVNNVQIGPKTVA